MNGETRLTIVGAVATVLAAISLSPLFTNAAWFLASLGAVAVATGAAESARRLSVPRTLAPVSALAGLLCYLTGLFARQEAWLGFIPTPDALRVLADVAGRGFTDIQRYAAPVPSFTSITLVTAGGIGLVAVLVDGLAVRARRPALAGLPLLAVFSVTSAIQGGAGWLAFTLAAIGFCALLMADARERMGRWGRRTSMREDEPHRVSHPVDTMTLAASGRRIGFTAIAIAVAVPAVMPELPGRTAVSGWLSGFGAGGSMTSAIQAPSPMVSLKRELTLPTDQTVLTYTTEDRQPAYLRLYALSEFNGRDWLMAPLRGPRVRDLPDGELADPPGTRRVPAEQVTTRVTINRRVQGLRFLPLPYPSRNVQIQGAWRYDLRSLMVFSHGDVAGGRDYEVTSWDLRPTRERLRTASPPPVPISSTYTDLPDELPGLVRELAFRITADADNPYDQAMALQEWFTGAGDFTYSLRVHPGDGSSALVDFLRERIGYCEQFASAMAVMARVLGIPARVSVGYTAGTQQEDDHWTVTTHDAHAWPELYFDGVGWLRFEPTPAASGQPTATTPTYAQPPSDTPGGGAGGTTQDQTEASPEEESLDTVGSVDTPRLEQLNAGPLSGYGAANQSQPATQPFPVGIVVVGILIVLLACTPASFRRGMRLWRWSRARDATGQAHAAWNELRDDARDLGVQWRGSDSPRGAARRLRSDHTLADEADAALTRIITAEERARYAPTPADAEGLRADSRTVRKALASSVTLPRRLLGAVLPGSALQVPAKVGAWITDGLNWLDTADARLRARINRRNRTAT